MKIIALDAHKRYSQVCVQKKNGQILCEKRINHSKDIPVNYISESGKGKAMPKPLEQSAGTWLRRVFGY